MLKQMEVFKDLFLQQKLKQFTFEDGEFRVHVEYSTQSCYGMNYFLRIHFRDFVDYDQANEPEVMWDNIIRYVDFINEILEDPTDYIRRMRELGFISEETIFNTIKEIRGEKYYE